MFRKSIFIASVLLGFCVSSDAHAQKTTDAAILIQSLMDKVSGIRSLDKELASSFSIENMKKGLGGNGAWKSSLKAGGGIFDKKSNRGGAKQAKPVVPSGLDDKVDEPDKASDWIQENMTVSEKASTKEKTAHKQKKRDMKFAALASGYGRVVSIRKQLDKDLASIEKLKQDAESRESEVDLQNDINKVTLLILEQVNYQQLIDTTEMYYQAADDLLDIANDDKNEKGKK